jgi:hypothetical protein
MSAAASFSCDVNGTSFGGEASAELGLGPYGIGVSTTTSAFGYHSLFDFVSSTVEVSWSQEFVITGVEGTGYVAPQLGGGPFGFCNAPPFGGGVHLVLFGASCAGGWGNDFGIPVTFGVPYTITISGSMACSSFDQLNDCGAYGGQMTTYVSDLIFTDSTGNPLTVLSIAPGVISLAPVPEIPGWALLATCTLAIAILRRREFSLPRMLR